MDMELKVKGNSGQRKESSTKVPDVSKYNLRCNRNLSEKMTKKDFVYDIRRPVPTAKRIERRINRPMVLWNQQRQRAQPVMTEYSVKSQKSYNGGDGHAVMLPIYRTLEFECNFCHEAIATRSSLSTHVKFHRRNYCKKCYWIFKEGETIEKHIQRTHESNLGICGKSVKEYDIGK